jgi:hypothetical protein
VAEPPTVPGAKPGAGPLATNVPAAPAPRPSRRESVAFHLALLGCYVAAGVAVSLPRASYLAGRLPATVDQSS